MATAHELGEKVRYVVKALDRTRELTSLLPTDLQKRSIGKSAFVLVESGIMLLRRLNNIVPTMRQSARSGLKDALNQAEADYEKTFALLRNKMHGHRQDVPMSDALGVWQAMHDDYVAYFREEFVNAYDQIRERDANLPRIKGAKPLQDRLRKRVRTATKTSDLYFNASKQGLFSASGLSMMAGGLSERGQEVIDALDVLDLCRRLHLAVKGNNEYARLTIILYLVEVLAMFDALDYSITSLENAKKQIDTKNVRDRSLRNKIAAHIDPKNL